MASAAEPTVPASAGPPSPPSSSSLLQAAFDSLWQPGLNTPMRRAMDVCFYALFAVLAAMLWLTSGNGHVVALLCIATGLFFAVHWFLAELDRLPSSATQVQQMPSASEAEPAATTVRKDQ